MEKKFHGLAGRKMKTESRDGRFAVECVSCINPEDGNLIVEVSCKTEGADCGSICTTSIDHLRTMADAVSEYLSALEERSGKEVSNR